VPAGNGNGTALPEHIATVRAWLWNAAKESHPDWKPPDDKICHEVLAATNGDIDSLGVKLQELYDSGQRPRKSYAWYAAVLRGMK
jgi:hypothetical protein